MMSDAICCCKIPEVFKKQVFFKFISVKAHLLSNIMAFRFSRPDTKLKKK